MAITAQLFDGTVLEFPDDTTDAVINSTAARVTKEIQNKADQNKSFLEDVVTKGKAGILSLPGAVTGLLDIPVAAVTGKPMVSQGWEGIGQLTGFQPSKWAEEANQKLSPQYLAQQQAISNVSNDPNASGMDLVRAYLANPSAGLAGPMAESIPSMLVGGAGAARMLGGKLAGLTPALRAGIVAGAGEGAVTAGQIRDNSFEQGVGTPEEERMKSLGAAGAGTITGLISGLGGALTSKLGIFDPDSLFMKAQAKAGLTQAELDAFKTAANRSMAQRVGIGMVQEGLIEEMPQSAQERMWQNWIENKPLTEGVKADAIQGALLGAGMGGTFNIPNGARKQYEEVLAAQNIPAPVETPAEVAPIDTGAVGPVLTGADIEDLPIEPVLPITTETAPIVAPIETAIPPVVKIPVTTNAEEQKAALDAMKALPVGGIIEMNGARYRKNEASGWDVVTTVTTPEPVATAPVAPAPVEVAAPAVTPTEVVAPTPVDAPVITKPVEPDKAKLENKVTSFYKDLLDKHPDASKIWKEQAQEQIDNPNRYHNVQEEENTKGIKIGDTVSIGEGDKAKNYTVLSVRKNEALVNRGEVNKYSIWQPLGYLNPPVTPTAVETAPVEQPQTQAQINQERQKAQKAKSKSNTLLTKLIDLGGVSLKDKRDTSGEKQSFPPGYARAFRTNAKTSLRGHIERGSLDEFLPHNMRLGANTMDQGAFDSEPAYDYLSNLIKNGKSVTPYIEAEKQATEFERYAGTETMLSDSEGDVLDDLVKWATEGGIDIEAIRQSLVGENNAQKERNLLRMLQEARDEEQSNAEPIETTEGPAGFGTKISSQETAGELKLTGQTEAEIKAGEAKVKAAEETKAKEEAKAEQKRKAETEPFNLTGSDREADVAGAKDLFAQPEPKKEAPKAKTEAETQADEEAAYEALQEQAETEIDEGPIGQALLKIEDGDFETKAQVRSFINKLEKDGILDDVEDAREGLSDREQTAEDVLDTVRGLLDDARDDAVQERVDELESEQRITAPTKDEEVAEEVARSFTSYDEGERKVAEDTAKRFGGEIVWQDGDLALIRGYGILNGKPVYVFSKDGTTPRVDIESYTGSHINLTQLNNLIAIKTKLEAEANKKHKETPFVKFDDGIAMSKDIPAEVAGITKEWKKMLGIKANIYVSSIEDAKENRNNFTGPMRAIGAGTLNANERGSMLKLPDGSYFVLFTKSTSKTRMLETIAHELGHVHEKEVYESQTMDVKFAIKQQYDQWLQSNKGKTAREHIVGMRSKTTAQTTVIGESFKESKELPAYWSRFSEWYADQTARWAISSEKPVSVVDTYFARLGKALRKFYNTLKGQGFLPNETFKKYLDGIAERTEALQEQTETEEVKEKPFTEVNKPSKIEDFGEKIFVKKDAFANFKNKVDESKEVDIETSPLSKSWVEPDYQKLLDEGMSPFGVAFLHSTRDAVPTKPKATWKLRSWVKKVNTLRDLSYGFIDGNITEEQIKEIINKEDEYSNYNYLKNRIDLYLAAGHEKSLKGYELSKHSWTYYKGMKYDPPGVILWDVTSANGTQISESEDREEAIAKFVTAINKPKAEIEKAEIKFGVWSRRGKEGFFIGKKIGKNVIYLKMLPTVKEARDYILNNHDELVAQFEKYKEIPSERGEINQVRVGADHRMGANVSQEQFFDTFGFRSTIFGNTVNNARRQQDLNNAYDALMDLAGVLEIPPKALSMNGEIGLLFGADGRGGKNPASAHYSNSKLAINLTKTNGAGSLAHELFHALDNYFSRMGGDKYKMLTETQKASANVRPEVVAAFKDLMTAISATSIKERSKNLDKRRTKEYWSTGLEMAARAFESYVINKLKDQNASNDYLANIVSEKGFNIEDGYPYPTAAEIPAIRAAFDNFFNVLETKETDKGVMLYNIDTKTQTKTPAFKKWFGNSKIVDANGNPLVVYHGTKRDFTEFKSNYSDGLTFFSINPKFAGSWPIGTGSFREGPAGTTEEANNIRDIANKLIKTMMTPDDQYDTKSPEGKELFNKEYEAFHDELERQTGFRDPYDFETKAGLKIMPVYLSIQNPFDATKDYAVVEDFLRKSEGGSLNNLIDKGYHKTGNWLIYEIKSVIDFLKEKGYDGIWLNEITNGPQETIAPFSPTQIKSATGNRGTFDETSNILQNQQFVKNGIAYESEEDYRSRQIQELRVASMKVGKAVKHIADYGSNLPLQRKLNQLLEREASLKDYLESTKPENNSDADFMARATKELAAGNISEEVEAVIRQIYEKYPGVLSGLKLSVKQNKYLTSSAAGAFNPYARIVSLYKNTSGVEDESTVRHEIVHSLEQMMTPQAAQAVVNAWARAFEKAMKKNIDPASKAYFDAVLEFLASPSKELFEKATNLMPSYNFYQYLNPSEYWAVNAESMLQAKLGTPWHRFVLGVKRLIEGLKSVLGFDNTYVVHNALNNLLKTTPQRLSKTSLVDYVVRGKVKIDFLNNIDDERRLMDNLGVPNVPSHIPKTLSEKIGEVHKSTEQLVDEVRSGPNNVLKSAGSAIGDSLTQGRIEAVFYGIGLERADAKKYAGKLRDVYNNMLPSIALKNAIHWNSVYNAVLHQGKMRYDNKLGAFTAYDSDDSMKHVIEQQHTLRQKLGIDLADKVINTWFAAKRTKGIQTTYLNLMGEIRDLQEELLTEDDPEVVAQLTADLNAAQNWLDALESAFINVPSFLVQINQDKPTKVVDGKTVPNILYDMDGMPVLNDEAMDEIIALSDKHAELNDMMKNWTAVNHNMLDNMAFSGRISEKEAEGLKGIEGYSPWQRIRDEEEESLFGNKGSTTTSGIARFRKTRTELPLENVVENMNNQVKRNVSTSLRNFAYNRIAMEYAARREPAIDEKTGLTKVDKKTGLPVQGKLKLFSKEGRDSEGVRFPIYVNGKRVIIQIEDSQIADALLGLAMGPVNIPFQAALSGFSNLLRRSITFSGYFQTKQIFYDAPTAAWVSGVKNPFKVWANSFSTYANALVSIGTGVDAPTIKILKAAGVGGYHTFHRESLAEEETTIEAISGKGFAKFKRLIDKIGDASDYAQRGAIYDQVLAETGDASLALLKASDIVDWNKHGLNSAAQAIRQTVPFLGAYAIQLDAFGQAATASGTIGNARKEALTQFYLKTGLGLAMVVLAYAIAAGSDDDYWELDDDTRARNFYVPGSKKALGYPLLIPMHSTAALFFKVMPESVWAYVVSQGTKNEIDATRARSAFWKATKDSLLGPTPIPAAIKTPLEIGLNHSFFTGSTVVPQALAGLDASEQYSYNTSELGKAISVMTSIPFTGNKDEAGNRQGGKRMLNPIEADHLIRGWLGSVGAITEFVSNELFGENRPASQLRDNPLTGGLLGNETSRRNEALFYDLKARTEPAHNTYIKLLTEQKTEEAASYLQANERLIGLNSQVYKLDYFLQKVNAEIKNIGKSVDTKLTKEGRRDEILKLQEMKQQALGDIIELRKLAGL